MKLLGTLIIMVGVILIFDARKIKKKAFSFGDQNEGTLGLKITGFILSIIGGLMLLFI